MAGEAVVGINAIELGVERGIDGVARKRDADLILRGGEAALHQAQVAGAAADVDEERVHHGIDVVGLADPGVVAVAERGEERLGNEQHAVKNTVGAAADVIARAGHGVGRHADDRANLRLAAGINE